VIRLVTLFGERLNLNGDQANLTVIAKRLRARGVESTVIDFDESSRIEALTEADFIFIGHGSMAAWKSLEASWTRVNEALVNYRKSGRPLMAVASGAERLYANGWFAEELSIVERASRFVVANLDDFSVLGYRNIATNLPDVAWIENVLVTALHGPVLAKNPLLADAILKRIAGREIKPSVTAELQKLDANVEGVWKLEVDLANQ
jgi:CobQ-like glutamine amidotransferase family enzyme